MKTYKELLLDSRLNLTELAARALPDQQRGTAMKAIHRALTRGTALPATLAQVFAELKSDIAKAAAQEDKHGAFLSLLEDKRIQRTGFYEALFPFRTKADARKQWFLRDGGKNLDRDERKRLKAEMLFLWADLETCVEKRPD